MSYLSLFFWLFLLQLTPIDIPHFHITILHEFFAANNVLLMHLFLRFGAIQWHAHGFTIRIIP